MSPVALLPLLLFALLAHAQAATRIVLIGDSTVNEDGGWGTGFEASFNPEIQVFNWAKNGRSSKSFRTEGWWTKALAAKPHYVLIQFGHNDQPGKGPERETDPATTFTENLKRYIDETRAAGATPVLVTSIVRRNFDPNGKLIRDPLAAYAEATRKLAAALSVPCMDLYALTFAQTEALGSKRADTLNRETSDGKPDRTHLGPQGRFLIGAIAAKEFVRVVPTLAPQYHALLDWKAAQHQPAPFYRTAEAVRIARLLLLHQHANGGWQKNIDMALPVNEKEHRQLTAAKSTNQTTIDNGATHSQLRFLARVQTAAPHDDFRTAFLSGLRFLLDAQYDNGGWPQFYPLRTGTYSTHITYNDDAMIGVLELLRLVSRRDPDYRFVPPDLVARSEKAVARGIECILKTQVTVHGRKTVWCAQHDEHTFAPAKARSYELPSLSGSESVSIVRFLMAIERPSPEIKSAIDAAIAWFRASQITGIRLESKPAPGTPKGTDLVVVADPNAPPLWARFYDLETNRPFFCGRDGVKKNSIAEIEYERRNGYRWYVDSPAKLLAQFAAAPQHPAPDPPMRAARPPLPTVDPTPAQRAAIEARIDSIDTALRELRPRISNLDQLADIEIYAKAGRFLLEFPTFYDPKDIANTLTVLDQGIARARQLASGQQRWFTATGRHIHGFYSPLDGSVQPYGVTVPASYDPSRPTRLYVWLHGRNPRLTEASFIHTFPTPPGANSTARTADFGQIQIDVFGRGNNANHWAGEVDVFEAIAAVSRRYNIDPKRIILRGFSLGGAASWHIALHHPSAFAAAEIGAGTWPRRSLISGFPPHQAAVLRIWENITEWALNAFNLPIAAHDGDSDTQVASIPPPPAGTPHRGQLESSLRVRAQLATEGFPAEGEPNYYAAKGTPSIFLISANTGHGVSPLVRQQIDAFLKRNGDRGVVSPDQIRFLTYTTRYHRSHWVEVDALTKHYERAEINARRSDQNRNYEITTKNITRLTLHETSDATQIQIDGTTIHTRPAPRITLRKTADTWRQAPAKWSGLHKTHALQGPIDDAFLDPYLLVRPTGQPWNPAAHQLALSTLERFDRNYARNYRAHPRIKDDKDVTPSDFATYHVVLFGDPGSNRWIARLHKKLPIRWTKSRITVPHNLIYSAADHLPVLIYPNPLQPNKYIVLNSGLTIDEREYNTDYSMPRLGDIAILKAAPTGPPEVPFAAIFNENWRLP